MLTLTELVIENIASIEGGDFDAFLEKVTKKAPQIELESTEIVQTYFLLMHHIRERDISREIIEAYLAGKRTGINDYIKTTKKLREALRRAIDRTESVSAYKDLQIAEDLFF